MRIVQTLTVIPGEKESSAVVYCSLPMRWNEAVALLYITTRQD